MCRTAWQLRLAWYGAQAEDRAEREKALKDHLAGCAVCQAEWEADKAKARVAVAPEMLHREE